MLLSQCGFPAVHCLIDIAPTALNRALTKREDEDIHKCADPRIGQIYYRE